jgi:PIN domain nuclease of toxin-antitoxin system
VKFLIDTHILLWLLDRKSSLKQGVRDMLADPKHTVAVSVATLWEISIKKARGRLDSPDDILSILELNGTRIIPITPEQAYAVRSLPLLHGDPFDRMLVVQAIMENMTIVTRDKKIEAYAVPCKMV